MAWREAPRADRKRIEPMPRRGDGFGLRIASGSSEPVSVAAARRRRLVGDVEAGLTRLVDDSGLTLPPEGERIRGKAFGCRAEDEGRRSRE